jgi:NAD(P)-dependent dehydrogenase (short-subunit alcohol dehydrogenase family)
MKLKNSVVLITGANRGIGLEFARQALVRGAKKVYAAARIPNSIPLSGVEKIKLDVTSEQDIAALAAQMPDLTLIINNAGIGDFGSFLADDSVESSRRHMETNFFGPLRITKALAPVLAQNGGGAILNVLSVVSWFNSPLLAPYGASKSAAWALTNGLRLELKAQSTQVTALHMGFVDTDLTAGIDSPKALPQDIVHRAYQGLEAGLAEVLADETSQHVKQGLTAEIPFYINVPV